MQTHPVLALDGVTLQAGTGNKTIELLRDISFTVERGRTLGLVGESGAGKSMIGRLISGLLPPSFQVAAGRLLFDGADLTGQSAAARRALLGRRIAFVPQEPLSALNPVLSIGRQFAEHLARLGVPDRQRQDRAAEWLAAVHLPEPRAMLRRYPHELSGGQCQRVLIAMAFSSEPSLIVADEPTTALDVITQARIMQLLKEQQALHGAAVVLITHDLHLAAQVCDEVGVMYAGDMVERGPASAVLRAPFHPYTRSLRNSVPALDGPRRILPALPDQMPGVMALAGLGGCRFAPRCPSRDTACAGALPPWHEVGPAHRVRCADACLGADFPPAADVPDGLIRLPSEAPAVLELCDVSLHYAGRRGLFGRPAATIAAVHEVSLTVGPGEFVGLVGESGSGKSSVARLVMGLERPTSGRLLLEGHDPLTADQPLLRALREHVQIVFQDPQSALNPRRNVFSLVTQALEVSGHRVDRPERRRQARRLIEETGLPADCLPRVPSQLSGGQKQRVNIARALCVTPRLLVADEIVSGLDVSVQAQILNLLLRLGRELGISLLFISHDLAVVRYLCSRVAVMYRGRIVETGDTEEVFANPRHAYTRSLLEAVPSNRPPVDLAG
ncbi:MAG TPA: ABC transporter ATP-binding protein [Stellaceae bacterium]|nr:ABC transporter ATP-binding protein [Stellaceae bacterium]